LLLVLLLLFPLLLLARLNASPRAASSDDEVDQLPEFGPTARRIPRTTTAVKTGVENRVQTRDTVELPCHADRVRAGERDARRHSVRIGAHGGVYAQLHQCFMLAAACAGVSYVICD
jgi:hypothetical protein